MDKTIRKVGCNNMYYTYKDTIKAYSGKYLYSIGCEEDPVRDVHRARILSKVAFKLWFDEFLIKLLNLKIKKMPEKNCEITRG